MFTVHKSSIMTIKSDHDDFMITDGIVIAPRAGFEINNKCPMEYKMIISECINNGWLKPVANLTKQEYFMEKLSS